MEEGATSRVVDPAAGRQAGDALVGRVAERATIESLLDAAEQGESGALVIAGPPGMGKSALVDDAIDVAHRFRVLGVIGVESEMTFGYAGVHQLVFPILDCAGDLPEPQRVALDTVLGRVQHGAVDPFLLGLAVLSLLSEAARAQPILVVVDDAHWLDDESAVALSFVGRRLRAERVAMLVTMRDVPETPPRFEGLRRLDLVGLSAPEAHELFAMAAAPASVDQAVARRIVAATEGNPLALIELPAALTVDQLRGAAPLPDPLPIGEHLSRLFAMRAQRLDPDARMVLLLAAAERAGDPALLRRAAQAVGGPSWDEAAAKVEASGLATVGATVEFRHPLVRSAVYYAAPATDRRRAHAALADALDAAGDADRRAWHLGAAADGPDEQVARALEASAERARQRGGSAAAAAYLWRAAELTPERELAAERLLEAARAELTAGHGPQARAILDRARSARLGIEHDADAAWTEALIHIVAGNVREPAALLAGALGTIDARRTDLAMGVCVAADAIALAGGRLIDDPTRHTIATGTLAVSGRAELRDPVAQLVRGVAAGLIDGGGAAAATLHAAAAAAARDLEQLHAVAGRHVHVVYFDAVLAAAHALDDRAWNDLTEAWVRLARATGALAALPVALSLRSWLEVLQGGLGSAASHLAEIEDVVPLTGWRGLLGSPPPAQVLGDAWRGNEDATRAGARRMMQDAHERGQGIGIDQAYAALTVLELGAGRYDDALRAVRRIFEPDGIGVATLVLGDVVESAVRCGESGVAEHALVRLSERAAASGTPLAVGMLARARALVAHGDDADDQFRAALEALSCTSIATETARTQLLHGEWLRRARRRTQAREPLREALEFFETVGASSFASRARVELAATGETVRRRAAPAQVLTPQEAQIARLAASGERNRDIAAQLFITTSTVEYHLRKIFVKLGVSSRTQLAHVELPS
jgi:DNA-binding CsgD family transcriptional regulator